MAAASPRRAFCARRAITARSRRPATSCSTCCGSCAAAGSTASPPIRRSTRPRRKPRSTAIRTSISTPPTMPCRFGNRVMAEALRRRDVIDIAPRFTTADVAQLNARFAGVEALDMLREVTGEGLAGRIAVVSSFGAESAVLLHLIAQVDPATPVIFLETHKHFPETIVYRDQLVARLGLTNLVIVEPDPARLSERDATGLRWSYDPDGCCEIRKVE